MAALRPSTTTSESDQGDVYVEVYEKPARCGFLSYFITSFLATALCSALTVALWSRMGLGRHTLRWLKDEGRLYYTYPMMLWFVILVVLYFLDAYWPPHLPGQFIALYDGDRYVAKSILAFACVLFVVACFLMAYWYPIIPMLSTILLIPISVGLVRWATKPTEEVLDTKHDSIGTADLQTKLKVLKNLIGMEEDQMNFYWASLSAFFLTSFALLIVWVLWVRSDNRLKPMETMTEKKEKEDYFNQFACPLYAALSNAVFGSFVSLRVAMQRVYLATDMTRSFLVQEGNKCAMVQEIVEHRMARRRKRKKSLQNNDAADLKREEFMKQNEKNLRQLSTIVKVVGCSFIVLIGLLYVATQLLYADSSIASMIMGLVGVFFVMFVVFVYVAFRRLIDAMGRWLQDLPAWRMCGHVLRSDWMRAMVLTPVSFLIPGVLVISVVNQFVRKCRGIDPLARETAFSPRIFSGLSASGDAPARFSSVSTVSTTELRESFLTPRIKIAWIALLGWDWLSIFKKSFILCLIYFSFTVFPLLLNVTLAWLIDILEPLNFGVILAMVFLIGVIAFLVPTVPGMTVYIFGGLIISDPKICPAGFEAGAAINILLCWFLKLAASGVQQKMIGEQLGKSLWVRQTVGVHKAPIRCIEAVMRQPGLSLGKVAILCGAPDWPVSVLAGVLGLSLVQCEIGTLPIIFFVCPCALTGSFYLKRGTSDIWTRLANMMIVTSLVVNLLLWAMAAWAIQSQLERNYVQFTRRLPENVDLEWLDYKAGEITKNTKVTWSMVPRSVRFIYAGGLVIHVLVCEALFWGYNYLFGNFRVSDPIDELQWTGDGGLFTVWAFVLLGLYFVGCICYFAVPVWRSRATRKARATLNMELDLQEASWKEAYLQEANAPSPATSPGSSPSTQGAPSKPEVYSLGGPLATASDDKPVAPELKPQEGVKEARSGDKEGPYSTSEEEGEARAPSRLETECQSDVKSRCIDSDAEESADADAEAIQGTRLTSPKAPVAASTGSARAPVESTWQPSLPPPPAGLSPPAAAPPLLYAPVADHPPAPEVAMPDCVVPIDAMVRPVQPVEDQPKEAGKLCVEWCCHRVVA